MLARPPSGGRVKIFRLRTRTAPQDALTVAVAGAAVPTMLAVRSSPGVCVVERMAVNAVGLERFLSRGARAAQGVLARGARLQVIGPDARAMRTVPIGDARAVSGVAQVIDLQTTADRPDVELIGKAMSGHVATAVPNDPVAHAGLGSSPEPAAFRLNHSEPKAIFRSSREGQALPYRLVRKYVTQAVKALSVDGANAPRLPWTIATGDRTSAHVFILSLGRTA